MRAKISLILFAALISTACNDNTDSIDTDSKITQVNDTTVMYRIANSKAHTAIEFIKINNKISGTLYTRDSEGKILSEGSYIKGKREGWFNSYDSLGRVSEKEFYDNDSLVLYNKVNFENYLVMDYYDWNNESIKKTLQIDRPVTEIVYFNNKQEELFYGVMYKRKDTIIHDISAFYQVLVMQDTIKYDDVFVAKIRLSGHYKSKKICITHNSSKNCKDSIYSYFSTDEYNIRFKNHRLGLNKIRGVVIDYDSLYPKRIFEYPIFINYFVAK